MEDRAASCPPFPEVMDCLQAALFLHLVSFEDAAKNPERARERAREVLLRYEKRGIITPPAVIGRRKLYRKASLIESLVNQERLRGGKGLAG